MPYVSRSLILAGMCAGVLPVFGNSDRKPEERSSVLSFLAPTQQGTLDTGNDALRLPASYVEEPGKPICMEAEQASALRFTPGKGQMSQDASASGGLALTHVDHAEYHFEVKDGGTYHTWYRGSFPWAGTWCHSENMDGGASTTVLDSKGEAINQWVWSPGPTYELKPGRHSWNLTPAGWCGGTRLDKLLLAKDPTFKPEGTGPAALRPQVPEKGTALTQTLQKKNVVHWGTLTVANSSGKGTVGVEVTSDAGVSWQPVPATGDLSGIATDRALSFRLTLAPDASGASPCVTGATLTYTAASLPPLVLENKHVQLRFSGDNGALIGLRNKVTGTECVTAGVESPLFSFVAFRPELKTALEIGFSQAALVKTTGPANGELRLEYELVGGTIRATVKVKIEKELARFAMDVQNRSLYELSQVRLLSAKGLRVGDDCTDDYLCTPITTGCIVRNPAALEYPRTIYTDRPLSYPGMGTMCWMDLWDSSGGGVYLACEDKEFHLTELTFSNGTDDGPKGAATGAPPPPGAGGYKFAAKPGTYVNLGFDKRLRIPPNSSRRIPDVVLGLHRGDWHWGADRYREWAETWMTKLRETPDWLRDTEGWSDCHLIHLGAFVDLVKGRPKGGRVTTMADPPFPLIAMWAQMASCEAYWSTPVLHRLLGTEEEFRIGVQKQHELGHRFISYNLPSNINPLFHRGGTRFGIVPRSMYPDDEVPPTGFYPAVGVRLYDGALREPDGVYCEANVCNAAPAWQQYVRHIILDKYIREYGNDGMYLDGGGLYDLGTQDCKNLAHGHRDYGVWTNGFLDWLKAVKTDARRLRPGAVFAGEGMGDVYMTQLDLSLFYCDNAPQVYRYTFPQNIGVMHGAEFTAFKDWPKGCMELATVYGMKFGGIDYTFEDDPAKAARVLNFRRRFSPFQFRSRFVDDQGLEYRDAAITAKLFVRNEPGTRGALVTVYNPQKKADVPVTVAASRVGKLRSAWVIEPDGEFQPLEVTSSGNAYRFRFPGAPLAAILLLESCEPLVQVAPIAPVVPGESGSAKITVTNLDPHPFSGTVTLGLPKGWHGSAEKLKLATGETRTCSVTLSVPAATKCDVYDVYGVARTGRRETRVCLPMGVCRAVAAELHYTTPDTLELAMENRSCRKVQGSCAVTAPAGVTATPAETAFVLEPKAASAISIRLANLAAVQTREHIKAVLRYGESETVACELVQPPVLNGGFERCTAGDGWPDEWNYRSPESLYLKGAVLDTRDFVEGKQSLRLDPNPAEYPNAVSSTLLRLVPDTEYRVRCQIRRSAHGNIGVRLFSMGAGDKKRAVDVYLGYKKDGPVGVWEKFAATFKSADIEVPYQVIASNWTKGAATVWFDDIAVEPVK